MQNINYCDLPAPKLLDSLEVGDRVESTRAHSYLNFQRNVFHRLNPDKRIVILKSKFKEGVNIIMRAE